MSENQQISTGGLGTPVNQGNTPPTMHNAGGNNVSTTGDQSLGQSQNQGEVQSSSGSSLNAAQIQPQDLPQAQPQGQGDLQPPMQAQPSVQVQGGASPQTGSQSQAQAQGLSSERESFSGNAAGQAFGNLSQGESSAVGAAASGEGASTSSVGEPTSLGQQDMSASVNLGSKQTSAGSPSQVSSAQAQQPEATSGELAGGTLSSSSSMPNLESDQSELSTAQVKAQPSGLGVSQASGGTVPVGQTNASGVENFSAGEAAVSGQSAASASVQGLGVSQPLAGSGEGIASSSQQSSENAQTQVPVGSDQSTSSGLPPLDSSTEFGAGLAQATQPQSQNGAEALQTPQSSASAGGIAQEASKASSGGEAVNSEAKASGPQAVVATPAEKEQVQAGAGDVLAYEKQEGEDKQAGKVQSQEPEADKSKEAKFPAEIYSNWQIFFSALVVPFSAFYLVSNNLEAVKPKIANLVFYIGLFLSLVSLGFIVSGLVNSELLYVASGYGGLMVVAVTASIWFMDQYPRNAKKKSIGAWILTLLLGTATAVLGGVLVSVLYTLLQTYMGNM